jgi:stearoyl-CoA desaturase (Delta-9 desaturase)
MFIAGFFVIHWYSSFFLHSFFHHRYSAHNHVTMSRINEKFFFICCFLVHGSSYMSPYVYGIMHRIHHMHADTTNDPHSPHNEPNFFKLMLITRNNYQKYYTSKIVADDNLKKNLPQWDIFEKYVHNWITRMFWILIYIAVYCYFATSWWMYCLLPFTISMTAFQGNIINWWAHKFGYKNYPMKNTSRNIFSVDIFFLGEAYHNNHHKYPGRVKNAHRWFETDIVYYVMNLMHKLKIIRWKNS